MLWLAATKLLHEALIGQSLTFLVLAILQGRLALLSYFLSGFQLPCKISPSGEFLIRIQLACMRSHLVGAALHEECMHVPWFQRFKIDLWLKVAIDSSSRTNQFELGSDPDPVS